MERKHMATQMNNLLILNNKVVNNQKIMKIQFNNETKKTELVLHGVIGPADWENAISLKDIDNSLKSAKGDVVLYLNSPGGDSGEGIAIYERLMSYKKEKNSQINVIVNGSACSAALIVAMSGDTLKMGLGSLLKITEASSMVMGTKTDIRKEADALDDIDKRTVDIYMTKAKISRKQVREMMEEETWINAKKALEIGFATESKN